MRLGRHHAARTFYQGQDVSSIVVDSGEDWAEVLVCYPVGDRWKALDIYDPNPEPDKPLPERPLAPYTVVLRGVTFVEPSGL